MSKKSDILISIIVPIYNIQDYVSKCINSLCAQTYRNIEIILVNDGSTDQSGAICDQYAKKDERIKVVHKANGGLVSARQAGAEVATGEYVLNVDGDDWVDVTRVEKLINADVFSGADMIYMDGLYRVYGENVIVDRHNIESRIYDPDEIFDKLIDIRHCFKREMVASVCCWAIKRDLYKKIQLKVDDQVSIGEDLLFIWLCVLNAKSIYTMKNCTYYYLQRPFSMLRNAGESEIQSAVRLYSQIKHELDEQNRPEIMYKRLAFAVLRIIITVDCTRMFEQSKEFLYPYVSIKKGSKVVVYGAGDVGVRMVRFLSKSEDFLLCGWIDKFEKQKREGNWQASEIESIYGKEYDNIAIAIADYDVVAQVKQDLIDQGISEDKIAIMEPHVIDVKSVENSIGLL